MNFVSLPKYETNSFKVYSSWNVIASQFTISTKFQVKGKGKKVLNIIYSWFSMQVSVQCPLPLMIYNEQVMRLAWLLKIQFPLKDHNLDIGASYWYYTVKYLNI